MSIKRVSWVFLITAALTFSEAFSKQCSVPEDERFDCNPEIQASPKSCESRGCCWISSKGSAIEGSPRCFYPLDYNGYQFSEVKATEYGLTTNLTRTTSGHYPKVIKHLKMDLFFETSKRLRFKILDAERKRYEVPIDTPKVATKVNETDYKVAFTTSGFSVVRKDKQTALFNTSVNPCGILYHDQFLQISTSLVSKFIYGLGEHRGRLLRPSNWSRFTFWNNGFPPEEGINLYGYHSFFMVLEPKFGTAYGVFLLNSNAMDAVIQPTPAITFRTIGGILDFYLLLGPTPGDVVQQYLEVIDHPFLPPYWGLGFHLCRWGYQSANRTQEILDRMRTAGIPQDVQWNDIDYMDSHLDFTLDPANYYNLPDVVKDVHEHHQHYVAMIDPAISSNQPNGSYAPYEDGVKQDVFIKKDDGSILIGMVWPGKTAFPDFFKPETQTWWRNNIKEFYKKIQLDGIWLDMNEPASFVSGSISGCPFNSLEKPPFTPYMIGDHLRTMTVCASVKQHGGLHYDLHSLYGLSEVKITNEILSDLRNKRPFIISRSTYASSGRYVGHWLGDNFATWSDMHYSITGILNFNMFGIPLVGADICGFQGNTYEELCVRWHQLGAFYPFSRNHNSLRCGPVMCIDQDPTAWSTPSQGIIRDALLTRYLLLPYLYTLFAEAHQNGTTVVRPLFFEFPSEPATYQVDRQFLWGSSLLISPVLDPGVEMLDALFPVGVWYDFHNGTALSLKETKMVALDAPIQRINVHIREGSILPLQEPNTTTYASRQNGFELRAAINSRTGKAEGSLFWDDGDSLDTLENGAFISVRFEVTSGNTLVSKVIHNNSSQSSEMTLQKLSLYGVNHSPTMVTVNGKMVDFKYNKGLGTVLASGFAVAMNNTITAKW